MDENNGNIVVKKPRRTSAEISLSSKLDVLSKKQLIDALTSIVKDGGLSLTQLDSYLGTPDLDPLLKEANRLVAMSRKALPNSRFGSSADHYGYKRAASANNACKKYIVDHAGVFKKAKQWPAAHEFAVAMLKINMIDFDVPEDNAARNKVKEVLSALKAEAESKVPALRSVPTQATLPPAPTPAVSIGASDSSLGKRKASEEQDDDGGDGDEEGDDGDEEYVEEGGK